MSRYDLEVRAFDRLIRKLVKSGVIRNSKSAATRLRSLRQLIEKRFLPQMITVRIISG